MKQYKLLKDLPGLKKGTILSEGKSLFGARTLITKNDVGPIFIGNDLTEEIFEEVEPIDSIHYEPKDGDEYFWIDECGIILPGTFYRDALYDQQQLTFGNVYRTEKEAEKVRDRRLAEVRLRQTSDFKPDFEDCRGGWVVYYNYKDKELYSYDTDYDDSGETIRYATEEDARKSIKENREDWLIYFGVKE